MATLVLVVRRRDRSDEPTTAERETTARRAVAIGVGVTILILFPLLIYNFVVARNLARGPSPSRLSIRITGHQWWWDVEYEDPIPQNWARLANEIHIPVGQPVTIKLVSHDVIHSFWAPNLGGKKDLIPGHDDEAWIQANQPGVYRVQCAEFCGAEHAKMSMFVVAETPERFAAWLAHQRAPAGVPTDSLAARGRLVFEAGSCAVCHAVASTLAAGRVGPDLTHVASRLTLAAGTLPNTTGNLAGWILDPQTIKPGAKMPASELAPRDFQALLAYLGTLR